jgi:hypothetical protein
LGIALVAIAGFGCGKNQLFGPTVYDVEYRVTGSASMVDVTYENEDGGTSQESNVSVPYRILKAKGYKSMRVVKLK